MISKFKFRYKLAVVLIVLVATSCWFYRHKSLNFSISRITSDLSPRPEWAVPDIPRNLQEAIFRQPYRYLGSGSEMYAFLSEDGKYVIKFFRMKHFIPSLSDYLKPGRLKRRENNLSAIFSAYKTAYDVFKKEAGLVFIHLNKTKNLNIHLKIKDRLGRTHVVNLDQMEFVVQEKAELIFTHLKKLVDQGDETGVKKAVATTLEMVKSRIEKGLADRDKAVSHNYGFVEGRPIQLDIGRIFKGKKEGEYERIQARIEAWLKENTAS